MADALTRRGYAIEGRNVRVAGVEIDLLARRRGTWAIIEVKTARAPTLPETMLRDAQRARLVRAARALADRRQGCCVRILLAAVALRSGLDSEVRFFRIEGIDEDSLD